MLGIKQILLKDKLYKGWTVKSNLTTKILVTVQDLSRWERTDV
jgi:hypothetical protein